MWLHAGAGGGDDAQGAPLAERCEVRPPPGALEPELKWAWTGSTVMPEHHQVMMTPVVVDVNGDGVADIVFSTFAGDKYQTDGVLRAVSGEDGHDLWAVTDPAARVKPAASLAAGDLDEDGRWRSAPSPRTAAASSASSTTAPSSSARPSPPTTTTNGAAPRWRTWMAMASWRSSMATASTITPAR
ncbi:hypothetical protein ACN28S_16855 [Cystobacter fuscus]